MSKEYVLEKLNELEQKIESMTQEEVVDLIAKYPDLFEQEHMDIRSAEFLRQT